ncbi:MAG: alcohol dehydrogenase, partial [Caldithrix sp.]
MLKRRKQVGESDMTKPQADEPTRQRPLRLWPGVVIVVLQLLARFVVPEVFPEAAIYGMMGSVFVGGLGIIVWWLFFSRALWSERLGAIGLMVVAGFVTPLFLHVSIATGGMGFLFIMLVVPSLSLALVIGAVASRRLSDGPRRVTLALAILFACGVWTLLRTGGATGEFDNDFAWRWSETREERLLAQTVDEPMALSSVTVTETGAEWPGFLGPNRDGIIHGVRIETDWSASPPVELWRRPIGPGWSSFAVHGDLLYTQEQRGDDEVVGCYKVSTGEPVWRHADEARFWESVGGAGPRGTPTLSDGRVYTFGGTGTLNVLDAGSGAVIWARNAASDTEAKLPLWGFASSPLVVDDVVIVAASGALIAYDLATGNPRWSRPDSSGSYSSPHLMTIDGVAQVLTLNEAGLSSVTPTDGTLLWQHAWPGYPIVQPALTADGDILISVSQGSGMRRLSVTHGPDGWTTEERWTSLRLKPYYSEFVVHDGHAFGFDGSFLACIDVEDGKRKWKGGRYGAGQLFLLADQDLLLVLSEKGELALVAAAADQFTELARFPAIEGKT